MELELWTAFAMGLLGSLHCIGMCGPIALALPKAGNTKAGVLWSRFLYNIGRVITYSALGVLAGLIGKSATVIGLQNFLSVLLGVAILVAVLVPSRYLSWLLPKKLTGGIMKLTARAWERFRESNGMSGLFVIGILNGFLPCGLVYVAFAAAATTGTVQGSVIYMALFGLGTLPVMFAVAVAGNLIGMAARRFLNKLIPVGAVVLATLLVLRGLSLGIPYISPKLDKQHHTTSESSCH